MARIRHLRVRIKELASEAKHIRHEERKCSGMEKWELQNHRRTVVGVAARGYQLAYACVRGRPYESVENHVKDKGSAVKAIRAAAAIAKKFGGSPDLVTAWYAAAIIHISAAKEQDDCFNLQDPAFCLDAR